MSDPNTTLDLEKSTSKTPSAHSNSPRILDEENVGTTSVVGAGAGDLHRDLRSRHMQMIAIGGAIGAGLFVGSGGALHNGGPAALVLGYIIIGIMVLMTNFALAEMAVLYPVHGAFFTYMVRWIDPSWGFSMGWEYAIGWLTVLPFELIAASITIQFWTDSINMGVWVAIFMAFLILIQFFGVRGYGEVEFFLSIVKILACVGFIILGIIINCGGVGDRGYIGAKYWHDPGAFTNFTGFCSVFVIAAFAFSGTELVGLAAAETANPRKSIPAATRQVFMRVGVFYVLNLFILGLIVRSDDERLLGSSGANTKASPFVLAIQDAGIKVLPSIFNAVIMISVISVANACTFGSTRTLQAMAERGMAPQFLSYIDSKGRPVYCILLQVAFGFLAFIGESGEYDTVFTWLLALSGLSALMVWASICLAHIRMRAGWKAQGMPLHRIPWQTPFGVWGSYLGLGLNIIALIATFYSALYPSADATPSAEGFFETYLAAPIALSLYIGWKIKSRNWGVFISANEMDLQSGINLLDEDFVEEEDTRSLAKKVLDFIF